VPPFNVASLRKKGRTEVNPRRNILRALSLLVLGILIVRGAAACRPEPQPRTADLTVGQVRLMTPAEQELASSETIGTTSVLLEEHFRPVGTVRRDYGSWWAVFVLCQPRPADTAAEQCLKDTGPGTFEHPRIERLMQSGPEFKEYAPPPVKGVIQPGARLFKLYAANVSCTTTIGVNPRMKEIGSMISLANRYQKQPGIYSGKPYGAGQQPAFTCTVTQP
jgi:hypothetical protein